MPDGTTVEGGVIGTTAMTNTHCSLQIVRTLGVGGMATVYLARRDEGGRIRDVAVKKLHPFLAEDSMSLMLLAEEAQLGASIRHPNVVGVIELVEGDVPALVMEWVEGVDLARLVRAAANRGRRLPLDVVAAIARDVLAGLHAAHEVDIVHRDVSPQNILVGLDGVVRVTDFGVAQAKWRNQHTEQGSIKGKLGYLAPEQLSGRCDRRADVFGLGVVLWELLTGARMRSGDGVEVLVEIVAGHVAAPSVRASEAASFDGLVMRALERSPEDRFATAAEMLAAIERVIVPASPARVAEVVHEILDSTDASRPELVETEEVLLDETIFTIEVPTMVRACVKQWRMRDDHVARASLEHHRPPLAARPRPAHARGGPYEDRLGDPRASAA